MSPNLTKPEHLDPVAGMLTYRLEGDHLLVAALSPPAERGRWLAADRERPLYLRLADLTEADGALTAEWPERALAFASLYAPPVPHRRLAPGRTIPLRPFAEEALLLRWALRLREALGPGKDQSRLEAARAATQIRALVPGLPDDTVAVHPHIQPADEEPQGLPASLSTEEVAARLKLWSARHNQAEMWSLATNVFASLLNLRIDGITPVCLPGATRSGSPRLGAGLRFPSPLARIWYGLWEEIVGMRLLACERCGRPFVAARATQRFCRKACQLATGVERHRRRHLESRE